MLYTAENLASYLEQMNKDYFGRRTWSKVFGDVDLSRQKAMENLNLNYGEALGSAYTASLQNRNTIVGGNLISGQKSQLMALNEEALEEAYNSYIRNYGSDVGTINNNFADQLSMANTTLYDQAQKYSKYATSHVDYLYNLWDKYQAGEIDGSFFNNPRFANYMTNQYDANGNVLLGADGNPAQTIIGRGELENVLFDSAGNLTTSGRAFFEQMEYDQLLRNYSFSNYLSENDPDLYNWARSNNPYDYAPNAIGESTIAGTFNRMTGRESYDEVFTGADALLGLSEGSVEKLFTPVSTSYESLMSAIESGDEEDIESAISSFSKNVSNIINTFDLEKDLLDGLREQGYDYNNVEEFIKDVIIEHNTGTKTTSQALKELGFTVSSADGLGGFIDSVVNETSNFFDSFLVDYSGSPVDLQGNDRDTNTDHVKNAYANLVSTLFNYVSNQRATNEQAFYGKEMSTGGIIESYDPMTSKHESYYTYLLGNGKDASFLSSAKSMGRKIKDKKVDNFKEKGDNFEIEYEGQTFKLEVGDKTLESSVTQMLADKVSVSMGRPLQTGDVFFYQNGFWIVTEDGSVRNVKRRFANKDYDRLLELFK